MNMCLKISLLAGFFLVLLMACEPPVKGCLDIEAKNFLLPIAIATMAAASIPA
jgi:hypothetical protein